MKTNADKGPNGPPPQSERRSAPRYSPNPHTSCRVGAAENTAFHPAAVKNISSTGIRLQVPNRYDVGTSLIVELSGKDGQFQRLLMVRVVNIAEQPGQGYIAGCAFGSR